MTWDKSIDTGYRLDSNNSFAWDRVVLKLPGTKEYDCQRPWVFNQSVDGLLAAELFIYVDESRTIGPTETLCWKASRRWATTCSWWGIKDAFRKVQPSSQALGPYAGTVTNSKEVLHGLVSQDICDETRRLIAELVGTEREGRDSMPRARMDSIRGFLVNVSRTYRDMKPYLKGVYITLDIWSPYRDEKVWILRGEELNIYV